MSHAFLKKMDRRIVSGSIAGLCVGFALGVIIPQQFKSAETESAGEALTVSNSRLSPAVHASRPVHELSVDQVKDTGEEITVPETPLTRERDSGLVYNIEHGPLVTVPAGVISALSRSGHVRSLDQPLFSEKSELAAYLQLDEVQSARLEAEWGRLRDQIRALETQSARLEAQPDGSLEVILPELKAQIDALGQSFRTSAAQTVGPNRSEVLMAAVQLDQVLSGLGGERTITVHAEETGDGGWRFRTVVEGIGGKRTYVGENLPSSLLHLTGGPLQMADF